MKAPYITDLQPNQIATGVFLVASKDIRQKKSGEPYLSMILADRSGDIDAKMWDNVERVMDTFERNDFIRAKGLPQVFQNRLQFTVHNITPIRDSEVDFADFFPASKRDPEEMFAELRDVIASVGNPHVKALLDAVFADEDLARRFKQAPAAKTIHHAWLGGLLEHVLSLCTLCRFVGPHYPAVDTDLLLAGAILHDIGKTEELSWERGFSYSDSGQLLGHIFQGLRIVDDKARTIPDFPPKLRTLLDHMILSHHGELEYGSPKVPVFPEALLLHHLDNLDSKMEAMRAAVEKDKQIGGAWSAHVPALDRHVLKKERYLNPESAQPPAGARKPAPDAEPRSRDAAARSAERASPVNSTLADRLKQALGGD